MKDQERRSTKRFKKRENKKHPYSKFIKERMKWHKQMEDEVKNEK